MSFCCSAFALFIIKRRFQLFILFHSYFSLFLFSAKSSKNNKTKKNLDGHDQVMLYVDGMNGVMKHGPTVQWLYTLIASKYRLVVKTALKLLLVFVEYCEGNCYLLVNAIRTVDSARGSLPWTNIMK
jgi:hypothetical protein